MMAVWPAVISLMAVIQGPLPSIEPSEVDGYLSRLEGPFEQRLVQVLLDTQGTPYFDGPLGEGPTGDHDTDPLYDFGRADCVTEVEQAISLAASRDFTEFFERLQRIRYQGGMIGFESRNHFMVTDWLANNDFCKPLSETLGVPVETVTRRISRRDFFDLVKAPELGRDTPDRSETLTYVPSSAAEAAEATIPSGSLIVFVGRKPEWLFVLHCGVFVRDSNGQGRLIEASSKHGRVMSLDLGEYVREQGNRYLGFAAYRIENPNPAYP